MSISQQPASIMSVRRFAVQDEASEKANSRTPAPACTGGCCLPAGAQVRSPSSVVVLLLFNVTSSSFQAAGKHRELNAGKGASATECTHCVHNSCTFLDPPPATLLLYAVDNQLITKTSGTWMALHGVSGHEQQALMECSVQKDWTGPAAAAASPVKCPSSGAWWQYPWTIPKSFAYIFQARPELLVLTVDGVILCLLLYASLHGTWQLHFPTPYSSGQI